MTYSGQLERRWITYYDEMQAIIKNKTAQIIDARPGSRFMGEQPEPRPGLSSGHMPGAINIPFSEMVNPEDKTLLSDDDLKRLFQKKGVQLDVPVYLTCGSGVTACMLFFALERVGASHLSVYDGSWSEYASKPNSVIVKEMS